MGRGKLIMREWNFIVTTGMNLISGKYHMAAYRFIFEDSAWELAKALLEDDLTDDVSVVYI